MFGRWVIVGGLLGLVATLSCGSGDSASGFSENDDGEQEKAGSSQGVPPGKAQLAEAWPSADPDPGPGPTSAPTFEPPPTPKPVTCDGKKGDKGERVMTLSHKGLIRTALVHVPEGYDPGKGAMLVLNFHGFSSDGLQEAVLSRMNKASDERGFIAVYPYGVANSWNAGQCCGTAWLDAVDDVDFVRNLLDKLEADFCIDTRRVFSTGMSNGGFFSHRLGCELSDRIAAIAPVAGVLGISSCNPPRPVPVFHFHGTEDGLVPYGGGNPVLNVGLEGELNFKSVADTMASWRNHNKCSDVSEKIYDEGDAVCLRWGGCSQDADVLLCTITGGGHTWPGGVPIPFLGKTSGDISATKAMLDFFEAHPMP